MNHKQETLLWKPHGTVSLQNRNNTSRPKLSRQSSIQSAVESTISNHIQSKINHVFLRYGGFRNSPRCVIIFVILYLVTNVVVGAVTSPNSQYCISLNICVFLFQFESVVLYAFAFYSVSNEFIKKVVFQLANIDLFSPTFQNIMNKHTTYYQNNNEPLAINAVDDLSINIASSLKFASKKSNYKSVSSMIYNEYKPNQIGTKILFWETLKCVLVILPSYISGYLIFFTNDNSSKEWHLYLYCGNILDILRYLPQILHIALVRSYYATFSIQLQRLRERLGVIKRKDELTMDDYENKFILKINHREFIKECEMVIRPYRRLSGELSVWIAVYFLCNIAAFTFFLLSFISSLFKHDCYQGIGIYYIHYLMELITFFVSWMFLVSPYCTNQNCLSRFFNDVRTMPNSCPVEKCAIDRYIDSYLERSPFSIYSIKPSYSKFMRVLYVVFATITLDVIFKVEDIEGF